MCLRALSQIWKKIEPSCDALPGEQLHLVVLGVFPFGCDIVEPFSRAVVKPH